MPSSKYIRRIVIVICSLFAFTVAACTPAQVEAFKRLTPAQQQAVINHLKSKPRDKFSHVISDAGLARLRNCESGGNYRIVSSNGLYKGAYQFIQSTWNSVARKHYPHLVGVSPAHAAPRDQDRMARALWAMQGRSPWPVCGLRV